MVFLGSSCSRILRWKRNNKAVTAGLHLGAERRLLDAVLIHKHRARLSPRLIPGSSPRSAALLGWQRGRESNAEILIQLARRGSLKRLITRIDFGN